MLLWRTRTFISDNRQIYRGPYSLDMTTISPSHWDVNIGVNVVIRSTWVFFCEMPGSWRPHQGLEGDWRNVLFTSFQAVRISQSNQAIKIYLYNNTFSAHSKMRLSSGWRITQAELLHYLCFSSSMKKTAWFELILTNLLPSQEHIGYFKKQLFHSHLKNWRRKSICLYMRGIWQESHLASTMLPLFARLSLTRT